MKKDGNNDLNEIKEGIGACIGPSWELLNFLTLYFISNNFS